MHVPDDLQAVFGGGNGSTGSGDRDFKPKKSRFLSTKEGQTVWRPEMLVYYGATLGF